MLFKYVAWVLLLATTTLGGIPVNKRPTWRASTTLEPPSPVYLPPVEEPPIMEETPASEEESPGFMQKIQNAFSSIFGSEQEEEKRQKIREKLTVYMQEPDGSYVAVVVPSEAVMNHLVSKRVEPPVDGRVQRTIYLESLGQSVKELDRKPVEVGPAYKRPDTEFPGSDLWSGPLTDKPQARPA